LLVKKSATGGFVTTIKPEPVAFVCAAVAYPEISPHDRTKKSASQRAGCIIVPSQRHYQIRKSGSRFFVLFFSLLFLLKKLVRVWTKERGDQPAHRRIVIQGQYPLF
jgi:hypothetical protein